ncbi:hypothetical protein [Luteolibacter luteus]|uniref:SGNH/GDSL hydrolase family protein n=1 Tax=Luteolibacter luteus TaxID=2728835 RepID=A0A858RIE2_9BACT|nr:hypothetical protein [Luteolibacter luteus]QJE96976.1 hypothetical protein HHL09_14660 [Luteolibacter luteus]
MDSSTSSSRPRFLYVVCLIAALAACFGIQSLLIQRTGGRTTKSESNYFSSIARLQSGIRGEPQVMFLGSSITGRLPDRTRGFDGVANLGCDGGSAMETLRAMDAGTIPRAPYLIVEGNTLYRAVNAKETDVAKAMHKRWFRTGVTVPNLSASSRPSAMAYTLLMERKMGASGRPDVAPFEVTTHPTLSPAPQETNKEEDALLEEAAGILRKLEAAGSKITIVMFPPGAEPSSPNRRLPEELARRAGLPFWDLANAIPPGMVKFTDGVHMDPASATAAVRTIFKATGYPSGP